MKATILLATLMLLTSALAQAPQGSTVPGEISRLLEKHRADYLRGDADAWAAMYAEDAVFTGFRGSYVGRKAIRDYFAQVFKDFPNRTVNVSSSKIRVYNESGNPTVVLNVEDTGSRIDASGKTVPLNARESLIWVRVQGEWLIVNHQATPDTISSISPVSDTELRVVMAKRHQAMIDSDEAVVDRLTAKEYAQTDILGHVQDKPAWMAEYFRPLAALTKAGEFRWERYDERDVRVVMLGDTAVVTGELVMKGTGAKFTQGKWEEAPSASIEGTLRFTRVWVKRDGSWLLAALHNSAPMGVQTSRP